MRPIYVPEQQAKTLGGDAYEIAADPQDISRMTDEGAKLYVDTTSLPDSGTAAFYFAITPINPADFVVAVPADFVAGKVTAKIGDALQEHPA